MYTVLELTYVDLSFAEMPPPVRSPSRLEKSFTPSEILSYEPIFNYPDQHLRVRNRYTSHRLGCIRIRCRFPESHNGAPMGPTRAHTQVLQKPRAALSLVHARRARSSVPVVSTLIGVLLVHGRWGSHPHCVASADVATIVRSRTVARSELGFKHGSGIR